MGKKSEKAPAADETPKKSKKKTKKAPAADGAEEKDKTVSPEDETPKKGKKKAKKKKGMGCCGCLAIAMLVFLVILGVGVGVGWSFGNKYLQENFGVTIKETFAVVRSLYSCDRDKLITNAPTEADENNFYAEIGDKLYFKDGVLNAESFSAITDMIMNGGSENADGADESDAAPAAERSDSGDENALSSLLSRDNVDIEKVREKFGAEGVIETNYDEDFVAKITDRELMTFIRGLITDFAEGNDSASGIISRLTFEQLTLGRTESDEPYMGLVVRADLGALIYSLMGEGIATDIVANLLPQTLYASVTLTVSQPLTAKITLNNMSGATAESFNRILDGILKMQGNAMAASEFIDDFVNKYIGDAIVKADEYIHFDENITADGALKMDIYGMLASGLSQGEQAMTGEDLATLYTSVLAADAQKMIENNEGHLFDKQRDEEAFTGELRKKYLVSDTVDFKDLAALVGIGSGDKSVQTLFDPSRLTKTIDGEETDNKNEYFVNQSSETLKMHITERMLAALISAQLDEVLPRDSAIAGSLDLRFAALTKESEHEFIELGFTIDPSALTDDANAITQLFGEELGLIAKVDVTKGEEHAKTEIKFAQYGKERTESILAALEKLGISALGEDNIDESLGNPLRDAFDKIRDTLGDVTIENGKMRIPDVFSLLAKQMFAEDKDMTQGDNFQKVMQGLYNTPDTNVYGTYLVGESGDYSDAYDNPVYEMSGGANDTGFVDKLNHYIAMGTSLIPGATLPEIANGKLDNVVGFCDDGNKMCITFEYKLDEFLKDGNQFYLLSAEKVFATFVYDVNSDSTTLVVNLMDSDERARLAKVMAYFNAGYENQFTELEGQMNGFCKAVHDNQDAIRQAG